MYVPLHQGDCTLLLVDDESHIASSMRRLFRPEGYRILTADSSVTALEVMARVVKAVNDAGIYRFVSKPWDSAEVKTVVGETLHRHYLEQENRRLAEQLRRSEAVRKRQEAELERLERQNPGITQVEWAEDGSIRLRED